MTKVLVIVGPTASGKSALGVELARVLGGEIISADSRQVYRELNIGTGKITKREMKGVPHHLIDVASPKRVFSAGDYVKTARAAIDSISRRGKLPIVVGGTGFYIDSLLNRVSLPNVPPNPRLRAILNKKTAAELFRVLKKLDPKRAKMMDTPSERNNTVRLIRALEVAKSKDSPRQNYGPQYDVLWLGVTIPDNQLRAKIDSRLKQRIRKGMVQEARNLKRKGVSLKRMRELGLEYRSLARLLSGEIDTKQLEAELQSDIWRYARKQIGYWKRNKGIHWYDPKSNNILGLAKKWLRN